MREEVRDALRAFLLAQVLGYAKGMADAALEEEQDSLSEEGIADYQRRAVKLSEVLSFAPLQPKPKKKPRCGKWGASGCTGTCSPGRPSGPLRALEFHLVRPAHRGHNRRRTAPRVHVSVVGLPHRGQR